MEVLGVSVHFTQEGYRAGFTRSTRASVLAHPPALSLSLLSNRMEGLVAMEATHVWTSLGLKMEDGESETVEGENCIGLTWVVLYYS